MEQKEDPSFSDVEDVPTPYGVGTISSFSTQGTSVAFFAIVGVVVLVFVIAGAFIATWSPTLPRVGRPVPVPPRRTAATARPVISEITTGIQQGKNGPQLFVQWTNLPDGTMEINIFYATTKDGVYRLIGSIPVGSLSDGSGYLNIPAGDAGGSFYGVASAGNSSTDTNGNGTTPPGNDAGNTGTSTGNGNTNTNNTSTSGNQNENGNNNESSTNNTSTAPVENFLVQHFDEKIQISWQTLPISTSEIVVSRSASDEGPWTAVLTETNIVSDGPYSIEVVDDTLGDPYYYKMDTYDENGGTIATYGPLLLEPL